MRVGSPSSPLSYLLALGVTAAAVGLRWALDPWLGDQLPLVTLFGAVALTVWLGGYRPAILAAALGYLACNFLFIPERGTFSTFSATDIIGLLAYLLSCGIILLFGEAMRISRAQARQRRELLRITLASIGD